MLAWLCLTLICSWTSHVPTLCETVADHEQGEPIDEPDCFDCGADFTDTGVGCVDDCLEPAQPRVEI